MFIDLMGRNMLGSLDTSIIDRAGQPSRALLTLADVVSTAVVPFAGRCSLFGFKTQSMGSPVPPLRLAVVQTIRMVPWAHRMACLHSNYIGNPDRKGPLLES